MLRWIEPDEPLPTPSATADETDDPDLQTPPGLIAAGRDLGVARLVEAYSAGIFPWYETGQPVLWWSPDPRMVLFTDELNIPRSLRKTISRVQREQNWALTLDRRFPEVIRACAEKRDGQAGTWITDEMQQAYIELHAHGLAHSVEVWQQDENGTSSLVGGLYGVSLGQMFFGESMFTRVNDASKVALVALVQMLRNAGFRMIDCQQNTAHLARFGAREIQRADFLTAMAHCVSQPPPDWSSLQADFERGW